MAIKTTIPNDFGWEFLNKMKLFAKAEFFYQLTVSFKVILA
jgi:hypothetical protein